VASYALVLLACAVPGLGQQAGYGTWDKLFYKAQLPVPVANPSCDVTVFVYHSYAAPLHHLQATGTSDTLSVTRQPAPFAALDPTEIKSLRFTVRRRGASSAKTAALRIALRAKELPGTKSVTVTVPLTAAAEQELQQELAVPVGSMEVRIGGWGNQVYVLYLVPMLLLIAWMLWRRKRLAQL
jgi:hypothetical protein